MGQTCQSSSKQTIFLALNPLSTRNVHLTKQEAIFETLEASVELFYRYGMFPVECEICLSRLINMAHKEISFTLAFLGDWGMFMR